MKLEKPEMEIVEFEAEDIICTSVCPLDCPTDGSKRCDKDVACVGTDAQPN